MLHLHSITHPRDRAPPPCPHGNPGRPGRSPTLCKGLEHSCRSFHHGCTELSALPSALLLDGGTRSPSAAAPARVPHPSAPHRASSWDPKSQLSACSASALASWLLLSHNRATRCPDPRPRPGSAHLAAPAIRQRRARRGTCRGPGRPAPTLVPSARYLLHQHPCCCQQPC